MKTVLFALSLITSQFVIAQIIENESVVLKLKKDTNIIVQKPFYSNSNNQSMPDALQGKNHSLALIGNNGKGFDYFESNVDKMVVLKPDSANKVTLGYPLPNSKFYDNKKAVLQEILRRKNYQVPPQKNYKDSSAKSNWYNQFKKLPTR
ncbi:MAG: hypothetical protein ACOVNY_08255 [Chitinophagaceae bacterium]